jgi:hypothetical protein
MKKILGIMVMSFFLNESVNAEQIVLKNCFSPGFDTYGKKYNFKSYLKNYNAGETIDAEILIDEVIRIDTDDKIIYHTFLWKNETGNTTKYKLLGFKNNTFVGEGFKKYAINTENGKKLEKANIFVFMSTNEIKIKFKSSNNVNHFVCSGEGNSTLRSILKMLR